MPVIAVWALPVFCSAQQNKIIVKPPEPVTVKRGATATEVLQVVVLPGFHVNSDKPKDEFIIPLKLTWAAGALQAKSVDYPNPEQLKVGTQDLLVFTGSFPIKTQFQVAGNAPAGSTTLVGRLRYQACSSDMCFRPATIEVKLPVVVQ